ncbi:adenylosuccinate lyase [Tenacibaculum aestuariivivum]|uniref:adenylosuccinate lyase n=1 Tax=Tenacibaculum aestuariivivum TaxID=2006131 RepID=UPI003AB578DC
MSIHFLISVLNNMQNPARVNRNNAANIVLEHPNLIKHLIFLTFDVDNKLSIKAAWVLEWICTHYGIAHIHPFITIFTSNISKVHFNSAVRPCAKICEHLAIAYTSKKKNKTQVILTKKHIDTIIETGFDWLITDQKIAVRAYTMTFLFLFGLKKEWIHIELKYLITTKIIHESKGCEARGKKIINLIKKQNNTF